MTFQPFYQKEVINYPEITCVNCPKACRYRNKKLRKVEVNLFKRHYVIKGKIAKLVITKLHLIIDYELATYYENAKDMVWCSLKRMNVSSGFAFICPFYQENVFPKLFREVNEKRILNGKPPKIVRRGKKCKRERRK